MLTKDQAPSTKDHIQDQIHQAAEHAGPEWTERAYRFILDYLRNHKFLHVDDLWDAGLDRPESPRALGAVIQRVAGEGHMEQITLTVDYRSLPGVVTAVAARPSKASNGQLKPLWRSLMYGEGE